MLSREQKMAVERFAQAVDGALLPYPTADKIIEEVLKNGAGSRETVMRMLLVFGAECVSSKDKGLEQLRSDLATCRK